VDDLADYSPLKALPPSCIRSDLSRPTSGSLKAETRRLLVNHVAIPSSDKHDWQKQSMACVLHMPNKLGSSMEKFFAVMPFGKTMTCANRAVDG
jgi:hypothetical protein